MSESSQSESSMFKIQDEGTAVGGEDAALSFGQVSVLKGLFGVLYTVSKVNQGSVFIRALLTLIACSQERAPSFAMTLFRLGIEWTQLFLLLVSYQYGYNVLVNSSGM